MQNYYDLSDRLAPYACSSSPSKVRVHPEPTVNNDRTSFQHDRDRIIHSRAFRRLQHKTQVFIKPDSDHFRTRLTHTLEASQIARSIARYFGVDEDLCEAIALAHDLGHPPFGHTGENALNSVMRENGGFNHNYHTIRIVTRLETSYATHLGLNLTWATLEGLIKHNGAITDITVDKYASPDHIATMDWLKQVDSSFHPSNHAGLEAQIAAISDDIAYSHHDFEDGLVDGIFNLDDACAALPHIASSRAAINERYPSLESPIEHRELKRYLIHFAISDLIKTTQNNLTKHKIAMVSDIRHAPEEIVAFSTAFRPTMDTMKSFLFQNLYEKGNIILQRTNANVLVQRLFHHYCENPDDMSQPHSDQAKSGDTQRRQIVVKDFIAGMTDNYAVAKYRAHINTADDLDIDKIFSTS